MANNLLVNVVNAILRCKRKMIIHKGERFIPAKYRDEAELENVVYENLANMFGDEAIKVPFKTKLRTDDGFETLPDAIILDFKNNKWFIVEVELAAHPSYRHILPQVTKQKNAVSTPEGKERFIDAVFTKIEESPGIRKQILKQGIEEIKIKDKLEQLIKKNQPILAIPIDKVTKDLRTWKSDQKYVIDFWQIMKYLPIDHEIEPLYVFPERTKPSFAYAPGSKAKRLETITRRNGPLSDLVSAGALGEDEVIFLPCKTRKGEPDDDYGEVTKDGWILVFGYRLSPTFAAKYYNDQRGAKGKAVDGWTSWVNHERKTLQMLRSELPRKKGKVKRAKLRSPSK